MLKNKKSLRFSEKELGQLLLSNKNITCNVTDLTLLNIEPSLKLTPKKQSKTKSEKSDEPKKERNSDVDSYINKIKTTKIQFIETEDTLYIEFIGLKLIPFNQLAQIIQYRPHKLYEYKKALKLLIHYFCLEHKVKFSVAQNESIQLFLYREANRLVDNDTLSISFKYLIDNFRYNNILPEDDPTIIKDIQCFQNKSKEEKTAVILKKVNSQFNHLTSLDEFKSLINKKESYV